VKHRDLYDRFTYALHTTAVDPVSGLVFGQAAEALVLHRMATAVLEQLPQPKRQTSREQALCEAAAVALVLIDQTRHVAAGRWHKVHSAVYERFVAARDELPTLPPPHNRPPDAGPHFI
jgi:hypothetical protein